MLALVAPQLVTQNIARAKSLFKRDQAIRGLESLLSGLDMYDPSQLMGKARYEVEVSLIEVVQELNREPSVRDFIARVSGSSDSAILYTPGQETALKSVLSVLYKGLREEKEKKEADKIARTHMRMEELEKKALEYFAKQDLPRAKGCLRRIIDEFGEQEGVLVRMGQLFLDNDLEYEAVECFQQAIEYFPREPQAYSLAAKSYINIREFEKAEAVYLGAIKEFGRHAITLANLAKLYLLWNKKDKALTTAQAALQLDSESALAKEIFEALA